MTMPDTFCVFVLSHGRPRNVKTLDALRRGNYSGHWLIVLDTEDATRQEYIDAYGADRVVLFDKAAIAATFDTADLSDERRTVVYARNACWDIARARGYTHFLQLDDDYDRFMFRKVVGRRLPGPKIRDLDAVFLRMLAFLEDTGAATVALGQGGDVLGGVRDGNWKKKILRKAMNTFFIRTSDDWRFVGRINEDVNTYTVLAHRGLLFFTTLYAMINQPTTQQNSGGMTEVYRDGGTYAKSFYTKMMLPSAVDVAWFGQTHFRMHHNVRRNNCCPKILSAAYRRT